MEVSQEEDSKKKPLQSGSPKHKEAQWNVDLFLVSFFYFFLEICVFYYLAVSVPVFSIPSQVVESTVTWT